MVSMSSSFNITQEKDVVMKWISAQHEFTVWWDHQVTKILLNWAVSYHLRRSCQIEKAFAKLNTKTLIKQVQYTKVSESYPLCFMDFLSANWCKLEMYEFLFLPMKRNHYILIHQQMLWKVEDKSLPVRELNPGLPRDRRGYSPLY